MAQLEVDGLVYVAYGLKGEDAKPLCRISGQATHQLSLYSPPRGCGWQYACTADHSTGISVPGVPELIAYRKPVVMSHRNGGLALTGWSVKVITSIKNA